MASNRKATAQGSKKTDEGKGGPKSAAVAQKGIRTGHDFANLMSALMTDLIEGRITPSIGNATCNAGGKLLKVVEMQYKHGNTDPKHENRRTLTLTVEETPAQIAE